MADRGTSLAMCPSTMMRITRIVAEEGVETLRVEGRLTHETVEELRMACEGALTERSSLQIDVSGLQFVDPTGVALLHGLERNGTRLGGRSAFLGELLRNRGQIAATPRSAADDDSRLVERIRRGDQAAFEILVRRYGGRMLATARRFVGRDEDAARDIVQQAYLAAFRAIDTFAGAARLSTWLHRIVVNTALMKLRQQRRRPEVSIDNLLPRFDEQGEWTEAASQLDTATDTLLERQETRTMVRDAIDQLPPSYRTVLLLRDIEELDTDEAAAILGVTPSAVRVRLHRARQALRTLLRGVAMRESQRTVPPRPSSL